MRFRVRRLRSARVPLRRGPARLRGAASPRPGRAPTAAAVAPRTTAFHRVRMPSSGSSRRDHRRSSPCRPTCPSSRRIDRSHSGRCRRRYGRPRSCRQSCPLPLPRVSSSRDRSGAAPLRTARRGASRRTTPACAPSLSFVAMACGRSSLGHSIRETTGAPLRGLLFTMSRRRPTLPPRCQGSTIGAGGLNFRVRNGTGCLPSAMTAETVSPRRAELQRACPARNLARVRASSHACVDSELDSEREQRSSPRPISTGRLNTLPCVHLRPIYLVVSEGPYSLRMGSLILGRASHLDAFSAYPCRTWLTSHAAGATTGTPEVRPPRSSRTGGSSPQASYAHGG